jgi:drug/metabolite transporter (DMT)-like permease
MQVLWITLGVGAIVCWGVAFACLKPLSDHLSPFFLQFLTCVVGSVIHGLILWGEGTFTDSWILWSSSKWLAGWSIAYTLFSLIGTLCYLFGSQVTNASLSVLTALTSVYPVVTIFIMFIWSHEIQQLKLPFALPGILFCLVGAVLLAFARK